MRKGLYYILATQDGQITQLTKAGIGEIVKDAETEKTEKETEKTTAETESVWSGIELLKARTSSEKAKIKLTNMQTELTEAMREDNYRDWETARAGVAEISRIMEKLDKEIEGMGFDNEIKNKSKEAIIGN